jgi:hypothetical protein
MDGTAQGLVHIFCLKSRVCGLFCFDKVASTGLTSAMVKAMIQIHNANKGVPKA